MTESEEDPRRFLELYWAGVHIPPADDTEIDRHLEFCFRHAKRRGLPVFFIDPRRFSAATVRRRLDPERYCVTVLEGWLGGDVIRVVDTAASGDANDGR